MKDGDAALSRRQPQRKKRNKPFDPLKAAGYDNRPHKHSFWWQLLHNRWIVIGGMGVIAFATVFGTCLSTRQNSNTVSQSRVLETATPEPSATPTPDPNAPSPTATPPPIQRRYSAAPDMQIDPEKQYFATIRTEKGDIRIQLSPKDAPQAVNNFVFLARNRYYDGLTFDRVIPGFIAQGGNAGAGSPGYAIPNDTSSLTHDQYAVALARDNSSGQLTPRFYVLLRNLPSQDGKDTVFGKVVGGQDVVANLTQQDPDKQNPNPADKILSVTIEEGPVS